MDVDSSPQIKFVIEEFKLGLGDYKEWIETKHKFDKYEDARDFLFLHSRNRNDVVRRFRIVELWETPEPKIWMEVDTRVRDYS